MFGSAGATATHGEGLGAAEDTAAPASVMLRRAQSSRLRSFFQYGTSTSPWTTTATSATSTPRWTARHAIGLERQPRQPILKPVNRTQVRAITPRTPVSVHELSRMLCGYVKRSALVGFQ